MKIKMSEGEKIKKDKVDDFLKGYKLGFRARELALTPQQDTENYSICESHTGYLMGWQVADEFILKTEEDT